jgi:hypothetical protein
MSYSSWRFFYLSMKSETAEVSLLVAHDFLSPYLTARDFRFFGSLLNGKGFPLF